MMALVSPGAIGPNGEVVRDWLAEYVSETMRTETLEEVVERLDAAILARIPELADRDIQRDLAASTRAHVRNGLTGITHDVFEFTLPEEVHAFARTLARRGFDLRLLLRTYHVGQEAVLEYMTEAVDARKAPYEIERAVLLLLFERSTKWVSTSVELLTDTYMDERERVLRAALNRRTETVRALLTGDELDIDQASVRLGYRLAQQHLAFVLWTDEPAGGDSDMSGQLDGVAARLATALGSSRVLTVPSGASGMWAWAGLDDETHSTELAVPGQARADRARADRTAGAGRLRGARGAGRRISAESSRGGRGQAGRRARSCRS
jgi:hypothetical protein